MKKPRLRNGMNYLMLRIPTVFWGKFIGSPMHRYWKFVYLYHFGKLQERDRVIPAVFYEKSIIYVHIPKAAGNSISKAIYGVTDTGHYPCFVYRKFDNKFFDEVPKIAVVRNPFSRFISAYKYLKKGGRSETDLWFRDKVLRNYADINHFIISWLNVENAHKWIHFIPQHNFLFDESGELLVTEFVKLEDSESLSRMIGKYGNVKGERMPFENVTNSDSEVVLQDASVKKIVKIYCLDFSLLGYETC